MTCMSMKTREPQANLQPSRTRREQCHLLLRLTLLTDLLSIRVISVIYFRHSLAKCRELVRHLLGFTSTTPSVKTILDLAQQFCDLEADVRSSASTKIHK